jgi:hypothetical protein
MLALVCSQWTLGWVKNKHLSSLTWWHFGLYYNSKTQSWGWAGVIKSQQLLAVTEGDDSHQPLELSGSRDRDPCILSQWTFMATLWDRGLCFQIKNPWVSEVWATHSRPEVGPMTDFRALACPHHTTRRKVLASDQKWRHEMLKCLIRIYFRVFQVVSRQVREFWGPFLQTCEGPF